MHHTAFVPYSVTAGCYLTGNIHELLPVLCRLTVVTFDPGIFPSAAIVLLGTCYDPIFSKVQLNAAHMTWHEPMFARNCFTCRKLLKCLCSSLAGYSEWLL